MRCGVHGLTRFTELSPEEEKEEQKRLTEQYQPLLTWLKEQAGDVVRDGKGHAMCLFRPPLTRVQYSVIISNRLVTSSCAIVADMMGYTANVEKMMSE